MKNDLTILSVRNSFETYKNINSLKVKRRNKICHENICQRKARTATLISDKVDVRTETITKNGEECYIITVGSIYHEDRAIFRPNRAVKREGKAKGEAHTRLEGLHSPLSAADATTRYKIG